MFESSRFVVMSNKRPVDPATNTLIDAFDSDNWMSFTESNLYSDCLPGYVMMPGCGYWFIDIDSKCPW